MLTKEQASSIKVQLIEQIESSASFPEEKKEFAIAQIEAMDPEALEAFIMKNKLIKNGKTSPGKCVFCSIIFGDISSYKIAENSKAIAVLEINPISKGHTIIIPKEHIVFGKNIPKEISALSKKVSKTIKSRLAPEKIKITASNILGHEIINIIPRYDGQENEERSHASSEELLELQKVLTRGEAKKAGTPKKTNKEKKKRGTKEIIKDFEKKFWLPKRIP